MFSTKGGTYEGERRGEMPLNERIDRLEELHSMIEQLNTEIQGEAPALTVTASSSATSTGAGNTLLVKSARSSSRPTAELKRSPSMNVASGGQGHGQGEIRRSDFNNLYNVKERTGSDRLVGLRNAVYHIIDTEIRYVEDMELFLEVCVALLPLASTGLFSLLSRNFTNR